MAGKITIRRIGSVLPTLLFLLIVIICAVVGWLSIWGFPQALLRYAEQQAAARGIPLRLEALYLEPTHGLALRAEGLQVYAKPGAPQPLITVRNVSAGVSASYLLAGSLRLSYLELKGGSVHLPVTEPAEKCLNLSDIHLAARMARGNTLQLTAGSALLQGIPLKVQGSLDLDGLAHADAKSAEPKQTDISALLAENQHIINQAYKLIELQNWQPEERPSISLRLDMVDDFRIGLSGSIPKFDIGQFHFRNAALNILHNKRNIVINSLSFNTIEPDATASLQGGFDLEERRLSFSMKSTAALLRMVRSMSDGPLRAYLSKFRHPDDSPPAISLSGDVSFEEDYALHSARIRGDVLQKELLVGSTRIDEIHLSFFYNNGDFNVDTLDLIFPDGSLRSVASARSGEGQAQVVADLPVQKILTLIRELADTPAELPPGLELGERVRLALHARLTTPAFTPGQMNWQDFVPSFHVLGLEFGTDRLAYAGHELTAPKLNLLIEDISQSDNLLPQALGQITLAINAEQASSHMGETAEISLATPALNVHAQGLEFGEDALPRLIKRAELSLTVQDTRLQGGAPVALHAAQLNTTLENTSLNAAAAPESLLISSARATLQAEQATLGTLSAGRLEAQLDHAQNITPLANGGPVFSAARLQAAGSDLAHGDTPIGSATLTCDLPQHTTGRISLQTTHADADTPGRISATPDWTDPRRIVLRDIEVELPAATLSLLQELLLAQPVPAVEVPSRISLSGECTLTTEPLGLHSGAFHLELPELVRTPYKQPALRGLRIPISLVADATLSPGKNGTLDYRSTLRVAHETGALDALVVGTTAGHLRVTGTNTIRPDIVDQLIDSMDAHSIIRDFRFPAGGHATVSDIDARIDYTNGLQVNSTCKVEIVNSEYMISVIEDTPAGERQRRDMGSNPYTLIRRATCGVNVQVHQDGKAKNGTPLPDTGIITISKPVLEYDNAPWLRRRNIKNGTRYTRLQGDSVVIDIERSFVELRQLQGEVYPAYSLGMFYPRLVKYLEDVQLPLPARLQTPQCVFPIYSDCKRPMSGTIRVLVPKGAAFRFLGTTIPLEEFSGFVYLTDHYVQLDRMNAKCWEGVLDATVKIGITGRRTSFDGYAKAQCMNLKLIAAAYDSQQEPALCNAEIRFRSPSTNLKDIRAYGYVDIQNGDLMRLSLFHPVSELISNLPEHFTTLEKQVAKADGKPEQEPGFFSRMFTGIFRGLGSVVGKTSGGISETASYIPGMNHIIAYDLQSAFTRFDIINGHFITREMKAKGYNLNVQLNLDLDLDTLYLRGNLWPRISSLPTILLSPLTFLSEYMVDINVYGHVGNIQWSLGLDHLKPGTPPSATSEPDRTTQPRSKKR